MILWIVAILSLGLMCGSELNVAAFGHPALQRQPLQAHILVRSTFAVLFGRVMPFWMTATAVLNAALLLPFAGLGETAWWAAAIALALQVFVIVFSLIAPVPINNRIARWTPESLPDDWQDQERRWDRYHWFRTTVLVAAFASLAFCMSAR